MSRPKRDFLTVEQLAERWGLEPIDVHQLIVTRRLPQAFLVSGKARIAGADDSLTPQSSPMLLTAARASILASTLRPVNGMRSWPLSEVHCVYEFSDTERDDAKAIERLCAEERSNPKGRIIEFDDAGMEIIGQDLFRRASAALQEAGLVAIATLAGFEEAEQIAPESSKEQKAHRHPRDTLKQRCRVAAEILWEKDRSATVHDLYESDWVRRVACRSNPPTEKTFREWVKDLNPNRSPGRRPS